MLQKKTVSNRGWLASIIVLLVALSLTVFVFSQRQLIADHVLAAQYQPSASVAAIRDSLKLTDRATVLFNASQPELQDASAFNRSCQQQKETNNPILGCYAAQRIYIFDIENQKLDGMEEVTAAHELLHAVYERMGDAERNEINAEIKKVLATIMTPDLQERLEYYRKTEPGEEYNELYAILGSEFPTLGDALERHYKKTFISRKIIVSFYQKYNAVFESVTTKLESQLDTINNLSRQTNSQIESYNKKQRVLNQDILAFNRRTYTSATQLQSDKADLEGRRLTLQDERARIVANIAKIKQLTSERNKLVDEYNALNHSINSSVDPLPSFEG